MRFRLCVLPDSRNQGKLRLVLNVFGAFAHSPPTGIDSGTSRSNDGRVYSKNL